MPPERQAANRRAVEQALSNILLAELRTQSGLTQRELAAALGISQPSLAQMEIQDDKQISTLDLVVKLPHGEFPPASSASASSASASSIKPTDPALLSGTPVSLMSPIEASQHRP